MEKDTQQRMEHAGKTQGCELDYVRFTPMNFCVYGREPNRTDRSTNNEATNCEKVTGG